MRLPLMNVLAVVLPIALPFPLLAEPVTVTQVTEWKSVYGRIEARDRLPARARLGGTLVELSVMEGTVVEAGQVLGRIVDEKLALRLQAVDAQSNSLMAQLENAKTELARGEDLLKRGVTTVQRLDALRTQVDVLQGQIEAVAAERLVVEQQAAEGTILAPSTGLVLDVPVSVGAVVLPGEPVAVLGAGGTFLRLAVPERHAMALEEGDAIEIEGPSGQAEGKLARIYPLIENGRVIADVEVAGLTDRFVDARVLVRLPVGEREAILVPREALQSRHGLDFVATTNGMRAVVPGQHHVVDGIEMVEIISGLVAGDELAGAGE